MDGKPTHLWPQHPCCSQRYQFNFQCITLAFIRGCATWFAMKRKGGFLCGATTWIKHKVAEEWEAVPVNMLDSWRWLFFCLHLELFSEYPECYGWCNLLQQMMSVRLHDNIITLCEKLTECIYLQFRLLLCDLPFVWTTWGKWKDREFAIDQFLSSVKEIILN